MEKQRKYSSASEKGSIRRGPGRGAAGAPPTHSGTAGSSVTLDINDFKAAFSFDDFFNSLVGDLIPQLPPEDSSEVSSAGASAAPPFTAGFPEAETLLPRFKDARRDLLDLSRKVDDQLGRLRKDVAVQDAEHKETLAKLERGVEGLFDSFGRLDARISGVGQTAARIGDHLQSAEAQRESAMRIIELVKYLMDFNRSRVDLLQFSPPAAIFSDDKRMGEAALLARKLRLLAEEDEESHEIVHGEGRRGGLRASIGLEVAVQNLEEYCNDLENKLLKKFDEAALSKDLPTMSDCAKTLEQFRRGSAINRYVQTRGMWDLEVMDADIRIATGEAGSSIANVVGVVNPTRGLTNLYKKIVETMKDEALTVAAVFPSPKNVMVLLTQRVMAQRVHNVLNYLLNIPSLDSPPPIESGGLVNYLRTLAAAYEKTIDLSKQLQEIGCGDLDVEGLVEEIFSSHRSIYHSVEQASLMQLFHAKYAGEAAGLESSSPSSATSPSSGFPRPRSSPSLQTPPAITAGLVAECIRWNEEGIARCKVLTPEPAQLVENVAMVFSVLLDQVSVYTMAGLERANKSLQEAAALRDKFSIGTAVSRRVAQAAAVAAEQAAKAGEQGIRTFMTAVKRATSNVAAVNHHFVNVVVRLLLAVDGAHAKSMDEMSRKMNEAEAAVLHGLGVCMTTAMSEVERLLQVEQKATEFRPPEDGTLPDHRPTSACIKVKGYLELIVEAVQGSIDGPNRIAFLSELGIRLHQSLLAHIRNFSFNPGGGLRLKRDVSEYADFVRSFKSPQVDEHFESLSALVNLFIVAPESLRTLVDSSQMNHKDALLYIQLRDDFKTAKVANQFSK